MRARSANRAAERVVVASSLRVLVLVLAPVPSAVRVGKRVGWRLLARLLTARIGRGRTDLLGRVGVAGVRNLKQLDKYRDFRGELAHYGENGGATEGMFRIPYEREVGPPVTLTVIASAGEGWEHVSVSTPKRCPTWAEMEHVKRMFFEEHETVMQLHVPPSDHISLHHFCLHLWRPIGVEIPRPPSFMVA